VNQSVSPSKGKRGSWFWPGGKSYPHRESFDSSAGGEEGGVRIGRTYLPPNFSLIKGLSEKECKTRVLPLRNDPLTERVSEDLITYVGKGNVWENWSRKMRWSLSVLVKREGTFEEKIDKKKGGARR